MVSVVTDSTADIPKSLLASSGVIVVPLNVHFGDEVLRDGIDIDSDQFFKRLAQSTKLPTTSQPSAGAFEEAYRPLLARGHEIISIHLSARLSGTVSSAVTAANAVDPSRITVVDSQAISMAMGFVVLIAAQMAHQGHLRETILAALDGLLPCARLVCALDTLTYVQRGGRIGKAQALLGSILNVKPLITLQDGEVAPLGRARSRRHAIDRMIETLRRTGPPRRLAVLHGAALHDGEVLQARVAALFPLLQVPIAQIGPVIGTHTGPGVLGLTYITQAA
jgi:DegV family protein with EDD domain